MEQDFRRPSWNDSAPKSQYDFFRRRSSVLGCKLWIDFASSRRDRGSIPPSSHRRSRGSALIQPCGGDGNVVRTVHRQVFIRQNRSSIPPGALPWSWIDFGDALSTTVSTVTATIRTGWLGWFDERTLTFKPQLRNDSHRKRVISSSYVKLWTFTNEYEIATLRLRKDFDHGYGFTRYVTLGTFMAISSRNPIFKEEFCVLRRSISLKRVSLYRILEMYFEIDSRLSLFVYVWR